MVGDMVLTPMSPIYILLYLGADSTGQAGAAQLCPTNT